MLDKSKTLLATKAKQQSAYALQPGAELTCWSVNRKQVTYENEDNHTLSIYLSGGQSSYRSDRALNKGAPGKLCFMPQGHCSEWHINGRVDFIHLYFSDLFLKQFASAYLDCDTRVIELPDLVYQDDKELKALLMHCVADGNAQHSPLLVEQNLYAVLMHLLQHYNVRPLRTPLINGGLSTINASRVRHDIVENLGEKLTIAGLATALDLSPFHFARMFKISFGESPAEYICRMRIEKIKRLLKTSSPLATISLDLGFSHQSHMSEQFRRHTGHTPHSYRKNL